MQLIEAIYISALVKSDKPPKKWWEKMKKKIKKSNPDYSAETVRKTIGDIWYHKISKAKKSEIRKREGKSLK